MRILSEMTGERAHRLQTIAWIGAGIGILVLLYLLGPILTPFLMAFILAYICNPLVERLVAWRLPRGVAATLTVLMLIGVAVLLVLILVPLVRKEVAQVAARLPDLAAALNNRVLPWLHDYFGVDFEADAATLRQFASEHLGSSGDLAGKVLKAAGSGGLAFFSFLANLFLTPLLVFYLLKDWQTVVNAMNNAIPRPWHGAARRILAEVDDVLSLFLRGQVMVMILLALYYGVALWLAGVEAAVPVGVLTGLLVFIPYIGFGAGLLLALLVAVLQFEGLPPIVAVAAVYGFGQLLEGFALTPYLVGERIGLHPMAVIFALLAFGQLFGFAGVLLALPASAALLVGLREVRGLYLASRFYRGSAE